MLLGEDLEARLLVQQIFLWHVEYLLLDLHDLLTLGWVLLAHHHSHAKSLHFNVDALERSVDDLVHVLLLFLDHADHQLSVGRIVTFLPGLSPLLDELRPLVNEHIFAFVLASLQEVLEELKLELTVRLFGVDSLHLQVGKEIFFVFLAPHDVRF